MDIDDLSRDLSELLRSENSCQYTDISDGALNMLSAAGKHTFNVLHLNICSLHKNLDNLTLLLHDLQE